MDFFKVKERTTGKGVVEIYPEFLSRKSRDLMTRGGKFYAVWDPDAELWSTDVYRVVEMVDAALKARHKEIEGSRVRYMEEHTSGSFEAFLRYIRNNENNYHQLNQFLAFSNTKVKKTDYISRRLDYPLEPGDHSAWDELVGKLYSDEELSKIEWAIGSIVSGDSVDIQKFLVLYGSAKTGKSTVLHIVDRLFAGFTNIFDAKALGANGQSFALEVFKENPLVGIQHDGDLSKIEDNTRLNSLVSHETMSINEKYKSQYNIRINTFLFMGTNNPVKISDSRSGLIRRLIDVQPTGKLHTFDHYQVLMSRIEFELGAIAHHCLKVYKKLGKNYYDNYRPTRMMYSTNVFYNFVEAYFVDLKDPEGITLKRAYTLYKEFCLESNNKPMQMQIFRNEMSNYFEEFHNRITINNNEVYSLFRGFRMDKLTGVTDDPEEGYTITLEQTDSLLDDILADQPAQYANKAEMPKKRWVNVDTKLKDLDTTQLHYVKVPEQHIVIDFDLKDDEGNKSLDLNLEAASAWPMTYTELSKGGQGLHLHYIYNGDVTDLANEYSPGIEIKTLRGDASLRRRLSKCNNEPVATLTSGLPTKEKKMLDVKQVQSEKGLRDLIARNLRKEVHPGTKPSIDFIKKILDDAYESGLSYDVSDLRSRIIAFANNSTNKPFECLKIVQYMKFKSEDQMRQLEPPGDEVKTYFDVEVYPNLFVVCWKHEGDNPTVRMINPTSQDIEPMFQMKLVGFNNRRYDNHILYAAFLGYDNSALYKLSKELIENKNRNAYFGEAYGLSYADIWDYASIKKGLKRWQIELGLPHKEIDIPWDESVPEERWIDVANYCANDVETTEKVAEARTQDFVARQILAEISGLTVNDTTQRHTAQIIFGSRNGPKDEFVYTDLSETFPGYTFEAGKSSYRGEDPSEGGYVYAEPGIYENVAVLDVASMHPTSIIELNLFGQYTSRFKELVEARLAIKNQEYERARHLLDGKLGQFVDDSTDTAADLAYALKIVINIVYGLTSAKFENAFRDDRNVDNIVAKRGALFMIELKHAVQDMGYQVVHIKTDSIKVPGATPELIADIMEFGRKYGYTFEHEKTYDKFCLVNDAVYIAREGDKWDAVGAQFQHPYVYKTLFTKENVEFQGLCETRSVVSGAIYLEFEEGMHFIGRTGCFIPVIEGEGGGTLYRVKDGRKYALSGTKGYFWKEAEVVRDLGPTEWMNIDTSYYTGLVEDAIETIEKFGSFEEFVED